MKEFETARRFEPAARGAAFPALRAVPAAQPDRRGRGGAPHFPGNQEASRKAPPFPRTWNGPSTRRFMTPSMRRRRRRWPRRCTAANGSPVASIPGRPARPPPSSMAEPGPACWPGRRPKPRRTGAAPVSGLEGLRDVVYIAPGDFDNDGLTDLAVVTKTGVALYRNVNGKFVKHADLATGSFRQAVWLDYDHDYDLDLVSDRRRIEIAAQQRAGRLQRRDQPLPICKRPSALCRALRPGTGHAWASIWWSPTRTAREFCIATAWVERTKR